MRALLLASVAAGVPLAWMARGRPSVALAALGALVAGWMLPRLSRRAGRPLAAWEEVAWLLPFAACWGLGEGLGLFARWEWWDALAHGLGGLAIAVVVGAWFQPASLLLPRTLHVAALALTALGIGMLWELGEFGLDQVLGTRTQAGLADTMSDALFDLIGALVGAAAVLLTRRIASQRARALAQRARSITGRPLHAAGGRV